MKATTKTLRKNLFENMELLMNGKIDDTRANSVARMSAHIISSSRLDMAHKRHELMFGQKINETELA